MQQFPYIDVHSHFNLEQFAEDWSTALDRAHKAGVGCITVGVEAASSQKAIEIAGLREDGVWATVGIHPNRTEAGSAADLDQIAHMAQDEKVVAIGECGFDYFRSEEDVWAAQRALFDAQIGIAEENKKPLMLHIRSGADRNAYQDALEVLRLHPNVIGNVHFFAGSYDDAKGFFDIGYSVSFTGVITFARDYDETVKHAPLSMLHIETDAPYAAPIPHRGKRNEPSYVLEVIQKIAELRGLPLEEVAAQLRTNATTFFGI